MDEFLTDENRILIYNQIRKKYARVSENPEGYFKYPTGVQGLTGLGYPPEVINLLPKRAIASYCGVGNPFSLGTISEGESVLDIGCGGGIDTFIAAAKAGDQGRAVGIDAIPEMIERATDNLKETTFTNVTLQVASAERLPFPDDSFDVVLSNGVFNLVPDKPAALAEAYRVLKPGGRFLMADQVLKHKPVKEDKARVDTWSQ